MNFFKRSTQTKLFPVFFSSLKSKLTAIIALMTLLPMALSGAYFYSNVYKIISDNQNKDIRQLTLQINNSIESQFKKIDNTSIQFIANTEVRELFSSGETDPVDRFTDYETSKRIKDQFFPFVFSQAWEEKLLDSICIFRDENTYYYNYRSASHIVSTAENTGIYNSWKDFLFSKTKGEIAPIPSFLSRQVLYFARNIYNIDFKDKPQGILLLGANIDTLTDSYSIVMQYHNASAFVVDNEGLVFLHTDKKMSGKKIDESFARLIGKNGYQEIVFGNETYMVSTEAIDGFNLTSFIVIPKNQLISNAGRNINTYLLIVITIAVAASGFSILIVTGILRPIKDFMKIIHEVKNGNYDHKMPNYRDAELNQLSIVFNKMIENIDYLINQVYEKQLLLKESELESLKSQINPHFVCNVLSIISCEAYSSGNQRVYKMAASLGHLLRTHITNISLHKITLKEEMEYIQLYLYLQKIRFEEKLQVRLSLIDEELLNCHIPKLCIQPIVENAIVHGLENKRGMGAIEINLAKEMNDIRIEIIDDGVGFDAGKMDFNKAGNSSNDKQSHTRLGLYNSNKRIKLIYGEQYGITVDSRINAGTKVTILIPIDKGDV